jgi:hypothetical protein
LRCLLGNAKFLSFLLSYCWTIHVITNTITYHIYQSWTSIPWDTPQKCHFTLGFCMLTFSIAGCPWFITSDVWRNYDKRPKTVTRTINTTHEYKPERDLCPGWPMTRITKSSHYFNNLLGSTVILLAVIAYLTSDTTLKVVEGHLKGLEVQFQHLFCACILSCKHLS